MNGFIKGGIVVVAVGGGLAADGLVSIVNAEEPPAVTAQANRDEFNMFMGGRSAGGTKLQLGDGYLKEGDYKKALASYNAARGPLERALSTSKGSEDTKTNWWLGKTYVRIHGLTEGGDEPLLEKGIELIFKAIEIDPNYRFPKRFLPHALAQKLKATGDEAEWERLKDRTEGLIKDEKTRFDVYSRAGLDLYGGGSTDEQTALAALFFFNNAMRFRSAGDPEAVARVEGLMPYLNSLTGDLNATIDAQRRKAEQNPGVENFCLLGNLLNVKDRRGAAAAYNKAVEAARGMQERSGDDDDYYKQSLSNLAKWYKDTGDDKSSISFLEELYRNDNGWNDVHGGIGLRLARRYYRGKRYNKALLLFKKHLTTGSGNPDDILKLALTHKRLRHYKDAARTFESIQGDLNSAGVLEWADCYTQQNNFRKAKRTLQWGIDRAGSDKGTLNYSMGAMLETEGNRLLSQDNKAEAKSAYEQALVYYGNVPNGDGNYDNAQQQVYVVEKALKPLVFFGKKKAEEVDIRGKK